jgi:hypothetical protein
MNNYSPIFSPRLARLAAKISNEPITLVMAGGEEHLIRGGLRHWLELADCLARGVHEREIGWLATATAFKNDHHNLFELMAALIVGPEGESKPTNKGDKMSNKGSITSLGPGAVSRFDDSDKKVGPMEYYKEVTRLIQELPLIAGLYTKAKVAIALKRARETTEATNER